MNIYKKEYNESIASGLIHLGHFLHGSGLENFVDRLDFLANDLNL